MNVVETTTAALKAALTAGLPSVEVVTDLDKVVSPTAVVIGPPALNWEVACPTPTTATYLVTVVVARNGEQMSQLMDWVLQVAEVIDGTDFAVVIDAAAGLYPNGTTALPAYQITVEAAL